MLTVSFRIKRVARRLLQYAAVLWLGLLAFAVVSASAVEPGTPTSIGGVERTATPGDGRPEEGGKQAQGQRMEIAFTRTGGFVAAPGKTIQATVRLEPGRPADVESAAEVESGADAYHRVLSEQETGQLRQMIDSVRRLGIEGDLRRHRSGADQYQYDIRWTVDDGTSHTLTVDGQSFAELKGIAPGLGELANWVRQEAERIWQQRRHRR